MLEATARMSEQREEQNDDMRRLNRRVDEMMSTMNIQGSLLHQHWSGCARYCRALTPLHMQSYNMAAGYHFTNHLHSQMAAIVCPATVYLQLPSLCPYWNDCSASCFHDPQSNPERPRSESWIGPFELSLSKLW